MVVSRTLSVARRYGCLLLSWPPNIVVLDNQYATLRYYPAEKIVHHTFHKAIGGAEFRAILNGGADLLARNGAHKWLSDDRNNSAMSDEDTQWSMTDWFPRAVQSGWKFWALVVPADGMAKLNMKEFIDMYFEKGLRIMVFVDPAEAWKWLRNIE